MLVMIVIKHIVLTNRCMLINTGALFLPDRTGTKEFEQVCDARESSYLLQRMWVLIHCYNAVKLDIVQRLQRRRLTYFGHVALMNSSRYPNLLLHGYGSGQRSRGRPKKKWVDNIKEDCTEIGITINEAMTLTGDRTTWRSTVLNLGCQRAETTSSSPRH